MGLPNRDIERLLDAAELAANELTLGGHAPSCTCPGCMLEVEVRRLRQPCARKACRVERWRHYKPHTFAEKLG